MASCGIYRMTCTPTGDFYIGASKNIEVRWSQHLSEIKGGYHCNTGLLFLGRKYSLDAFKLDTLIECNPEDLSLMECQFFQLLKPNLNSVKLGLDEQGRVRRSKPSGILYLNQDGVVTSRTSDATTFIEWEQEKWVKANRKNICDSIKRIQEYKRLWLIKELLKATPEQLSLVENVFSAPSSLGQRKCSLDEPEINTGQAIKTHQNPILMSPTDEEYLADWDWENEIEGGDRT